MHIVSNINPSRTSPYGGHFSNNNGSPAPPSAGFTLLQGHIQLMAMVPNLPENQVSPRWKPSSKESHDDRNENNQFAASYNVKEAITSSNTGFESPRSLPITPRLMPSASKFKRPNLPNVLADKASRNGYTSYSWHSPNSQKLTLPPTPSQPVTMPSFAKCLPGTKRSMNQSTSCFPIIPNQPSYHAVVKEQMVESSSPPPSTTPMYMNPYQCMMPQMGYQMVNVVPSNQHDMRGSGDHLPPIFLPVHHHHQQQQCYETQNPAGMYFHQNSNNNNNNNCVMMPDGSIMNINPTLVSYPQTPYTAHSVPCFGTMHNNPSQIQGRVSMPNCTINGGIKHGNTIFLPPESSGMGHGARPVCSASLPDICHPPDPFSRHEQPQQCNSVPRSSVNNTSVHYCTNEEISVLVEDSSDCDCNDECCESRSKGRGCCSKTTLLQKMKAHHQSKAVTNAAAAGDTKFVMLGPESLPTKIPSHPRVTHTPPIPLEHKIEYNNKVEEVEEDEGCCSKCKCHKESKNKAEKNTSKEKDNSMKLTDITPRKKSVMVAVHDCFPSDSSVSDESDFDGSKKSVFNYTTNSTNSSLIKKRKPRIDAIMHKHKIKGESEQVFDDLNDLSPDEIRLYTAEYLTELLSSEDWSNCYIALQTIVRLARHRPKVLLGYLGPVLWFAFKHLTSPKSALCRASIVTFKELFEKIGSALDNDLDKLTEKLVIKSLAPNKFIREECDRALEAMVRHCSLIKVLNAMESVSKKHHVRAACQRISKMTKQFVEVAGVDTCLKSAYAEKLLPMLFSFMTEANNETRASAKEALAVLMNHLQFEAAVTKHVTFDRNCTEVFKKLDKMRGRNRKRGPGCRAYPLPLPNFKK